MAGRQGRHHERNGREVDKGDGRRLWLGGVRKEWTEDLLMDHFSKWGHVESAEVGFPNAIAYVIFKEAEEAQSVFEALNEAEKLTLDGRDVTVKYASEQGFLQACKKRGLEGLRDGSGGSGPRHRGQRLLGLQGRTPDFGGHPPPPAPPPPVDLPRDRSLPRRARGGTTGTSGRWGTRRGSGGSRPPDPPPAPGAADARSQPRQRSRRRQDSRGRDARQGSQSRGNSSRSPHRAASPPPPPAASTGRARSPSASQNARATASRSPSLVDRAAGRRGSPGRSRERQSVREHAASEGVEHGRSRSRGDRSGLSPAGGSEGHSPCYGRSSSRSRSRSRQRACSRRSPSRERSASCRSSKSRSSVGSREAASRVELQPRRSPASLRHKAAPVVPPSSLALGDPSRMAAASAALAGVTRTSAASRDSGGRDESAPTPRLPPEPPMPPPAPAAADKTALLPPPPAATEACATTLPEPPPPPAASENSVSTGAPASQSEESKREREHSEELQRPSRPKVMLTAAAASADIQARVEAKAKVAGPPSTAFAASNGADRHVRSTSSAAPAENAVEKAPVRHCKEDKADTSASKTAATAASASSAEVERAATEPLNTTMAFQAGSMGVVTEGGTAAASLDATSGGILPAAQQPPQADLAKPQHSAGNTATPSQVPAASDARESAAMIGMPGLSVAGGNEVVAVALSYQGRRKLVRHLGHTLVMDVIRLHVSSSRQPLVVVDHQGFEVGKEMPLSVVATQMGIAPGSGGLVELKLVADDFGA